MRKGLEAWAQAGGNDLLEGAMLVARYRYPELEEHRIKSKLAAIRQDIWLELNDNLTAFEKVRVFNHILFQVHGFKGTNTTTMRRRTASSTMYWKAARATPSAWRSFTKCLPKTWTCRCAA